MQLMEGFEYAMRGFRFSLKKEASKEQNLLNNEK